MTGIEACARLREHFVDTLVTERTPQLFRNGVNFRRIGGTERSRRIQRYRRVLKAGVPDRRPRLVVL